MDLDQKYCFFPCKFAIYDLRINRYKFSDLRLRNELKNLRIWDLRPRPKYCTLRPLFCRPRCDTN
jgi:hypothetical protein